MIETEVFHSNLVRPIAKLLVLTNRSQSQSLDDHDSDNWNEYKMNGEKVTLYNSRLLFRNTGVVFTLKEGILSRITDYDFNETNSPDAKQIINFMNEMHVDIHATGKSSRDISLKKNYFNKRAILASALKTIFVLENPIELCV